MANINIYPNGLVQIGLFKSTIDEFELYTGLDLGDLYGTDWIEITYYGSTDRLFVISSYTNEGTLEILDENQRQDFSSFLVSPDYLAFEQQEEVRDLEKIAKAEYAFSLIGKLLDDSESSDVLVAREDFISGSGIFTIHEGYWKSSGGVNNSPCIRVTADSDNDFAGISTTFVGVSGGATYRVTAEIKIDNDQDVYIEVTMNGQIFQSLPLEGSTSGFELIELEFTMDSDINTFDIQIGTSDPRIGSGSYNRIYIDNVSLYAAPNAATNLQQEIFTNLCAIGGYDITDFLTPDEAIIPFFACVVADVYNLDQEDFNGGANILDCTNHSPLVE